MASFFGSFFAILQLGPVGIRIVQLPDIVVEGPLVCAYPRMPCRVTAVQPS